ncbi:MAG: hypothetical protein LBR25_04560 [Erysipelotrichaceae bacterium]|jgi:hypothetical protein|nr:hypothetical protein [Erysipelotrichaceae bacterium]
MKLDATNWIAIIGLIVSNVWASLNYRAGRKASANSLFVQERKKDLDDLIRLILKMQAYCDHVFEKWMESYYCFNYSEFCQADSFCYMSQAQKELYYNRHFKPIISNMSFINSKIKDLQAMIEMDILKNEYLFSKGLESKKAVISKHIATLRNSMNKVRQVNALVQDYYIKLDVVNCNSEKAVFAQLNKNKNIVKDYIDLVLKTNSCESLQSLKNRSHKSFLGEIGVIANAIEELYQNKI